MMQKPKRDNVAHEMRERLFANRNGRLLPAQWIDLVIEPLVTALILVMVALPVFGARFVALFRASWWILLPTIIVLIAVPAIMRAYRYARAPIQFAHLYGTERAGRRWAFWRPLEFQSAGEEIVRFTKRLSPRPVLQQDREYLIYYLEDARGKVLLSCAPADHQDAELWQPSKQFGDRLSHRRGR